MTRLRSMAPGQVSKQLTNTTDIFATVASVIGFALPDDVAVDSFDMLPAMLGTRAETDPIRPHMLTQSFRGEFQIRQGDWKLFFDRQTAVTGLGTARKTPAQAEKVAGKVSGAYESLGIGEKCKAHIFEGGHAVDTPVVIGNPAGVGAPGEGLILIEMALGAGGTI